MSAQVWLLLAVVVAAAWAATAAAFDLTHVTFAVAEKTLWTECYQEYARSNIPGAFQEATIEIMAANHDDPLPSHFAIYNKLDYEVGTVILLPNSTTEGKCGIAKKGELILIPRYNTNTSSPISENLRGPFDEDFEVYTINAKGIYCVSIYAPAFNTTGTISFTYPYGKLPPIKYPFLPFYGFVGLAYTIIGIGWLSMCLYYWQNIMKVQIYIAGIIFLNMLEMTFLYAYFANWNDMGNDSDALLAIAVILTSLQESASLVCLLVVCMGYGLLKPTLGQDATKVAFLGVTNFIFCALYNEETITATAGKESLAVIYVIPFAITLAVFYLWTISELSGTIAKLALRRQVVKLATYTGLRRVLFVSLVALFVLTILSGVQTFDSKNYDQTWDSQWFTTDCSFTLVYFFVLLCILFLWRPRQNNARAGVEQIPMDDLDDDFEEMELGRVGVVGSVASERVKSRRTKSRGPEDDTEEDPLKWVEENIPDLLEDDGDIITSKEEQARLIRDEMSKMN